MTTLEKIREEIFEKSVQMHFDGNYYIKVATITIDEETKKPIFKDSDLFEILSKYTEQEPKTGHWIAVYQGDEIINYRCSECEVGDTNGSTNLYGWDYCRRCGAKMVEQKESEEEV